MTTVYHTPLVASPKAAANAATFNSVFAELDTAIGQAGGGSAATEAYLRANWAAALANITTVNSYHGTYDQLITSAEVEWPDGSTGTYTATSFDATWEEVTAWNLDHDDSGGNIAYAGLVRNASGQITTPATPTYTP